MCKTLTYYSDIYILLLLNPWANLEGNVIIHKSFVLKLKQSRFAINFSGDERGGK